MLIAMVKKLWNYCLLSNFWHKWKVAYWTKVLKYWVYIKFFKQWYDKCNLALLGIQLLSNEKLIILVMIGVTVSTHFLTSQVGIGSSWQLASDDDKMILRIVSSERKFFKLNVVSLQNNPLWSQINTCFKLSLKTIACCDGRNSLVVFLKQIRNLNRVWLLQKFKLSEYKFLLNNRLG